MAGFKDFKNAAVTIAGIELMPPHPQGAVRTGTSGRSRPSRTCYLERGAAASVCTCRLLAPEPWKTGYPKLT
jgi:hypothetical protein